jgi:hypothetical protein
MKNNAILFHGTNTGHVDQRRIMSKDPNFTSKNQNYIYFGCPAYWTTNIDRAWQYAATRTRLYQNEQNNFKMAILSSSYDPDVFDEIQRGYQNGYYVDYVYNGKKDLLQINEYRNEKLRDLIEKYSEMPEIGLLYLSQNLDLWK